MIRGKHGGEALIKQEPPIRQQLIVARERIIAQLDEIGFRATGHPGNGGSPPDYSSVIAELEGELRDIDDLLNGDDLANA